MNTTSLRVERRDVASLSCDPANARTHSEANLDAIRRSLQRFGQQKPIVVDSAGVVRAGNGTLEAARSLGWEELSVVVSDLSGDEMTAFAIADNRSAELAEWDAEVLAATLQALEEAEVPMEDTGFTAEELAEVKKAAGVASAGDVVEDEVPETPDEPITKVGDLWLLGKHRLLCGDSTKADDVERLMNGDNPNMMVTDPPYGVNYRPAWRDKALGDKALGKANSDIIQSDDVADWRGVWGLFKGDIAYVWHASAFTDVVMDSLRAVDLIPTQQIIWNKSVLILGRSSYHFKHEPCWYCVRKGATHDWIGDRKQTTVIDAAPPNHIMSGSKEERTPHPTQKALACMSNLMRNHSGDVYDPFLGSGTTLIAAEQLGRSCYGMELSPAYCDVIVRRWENLTGEKAVLA